MMGMIWYDKDGVPIEDHDLVGQLRQDPEYKHMGLTRVGHEVVISTVWLGLDHGFGSGPPLIFETMVFSRGTMVEKDMERYSTMAQAKFGHTRMVVEWSARFPEEEVVDLDGWPEDWYFCDGHMQWHIQPSVTYRSCYECGHQWGQPSDLIREDRKVRMKMGLPVPERYIPHTREVADAIWICPVCKHDF